MKKHLSVFTLFLVFLVSCSPDQLDPEPQPRYIPYAIYELSSASFDTLAPRAVVEYQYEKDELTGIRNRNFLANYDLYYKLGYDLAGNLITHTTGGDEAGRITYTYESGKPRNGNSNFRNSSFVYDGTGNLSLRIDSSGPSARHWRADSLKLSYTDTSIKAVQIISITSPPSIGPAEGLALYFNPTTRNPFDQMKTRVDFLPMQTIPFNDNMRSAKRGMIREYQMIRSTGEVYVSTQFEVIEKKPGTNYPSVVKVTHRLYPPVSSDPSSIFYQHILYREL